MSELYSQGSDAQLVQVAHDGKEDPRRTRVRWTEENESPREESYITDSLGPAMRRFDKI